VGDPKTSCNSEGIFVSIQETLPQVFDVPCTHCLRTIAGQSFLHGQSSSNTPDLTGQIKKPCVPRLQKPIRVFSVAQEDGRKKQQMPHA
jgi:hypothetical protein